MRTEQRTCQRPWQRPWQRPSQRPLQRLWRRMAARDSAQPRRSCGCTRPTDACRRLVCRHVTTRHPLRPRRHADRLHRSAAAKHGSRLRGPSPSSHARAVGRGDRHALAHAVGRVVRPSRGRQWARGSISHVSGCASRADDHDVSRRGGDDRVGARGRSRHWARDQQGSHHDRSLIAARRPARGLRCDRDLRGDRAPQADAGPGAAGARAAGHRGGAGHLRRRLAARHGVGASRRCADGGGSVGPVLPRRTGAVDTHVLAHAHGGADRRHHRV